MNSSARRLANIGNRRPAIRYTWFQVDDIANKYQRLIALDASFRLQPKDAGGVTIAVFDDTYGNLIQVYQTPY